MIHERCMNLHILKVELLLESSGGGNPVTKIQEIELTALLFTLTADILILLVFIAALEEESEQQKKEDQEKRELERKINDLTERLAKLELLVK